MRKLCVSLLSAGLLLACNSPTEPDGSVPFVTLADTKVPGAAGPQIQAVARDSNSWSQIWSDLWGDLEPALPPVDFSREMVVVVTASEICFGGAQVEEIVSTSRGVQVRYADAEPSLCLCAQAELAFHAVRAPRILGTAVFESRPTPPLCPV